MIKTKGFFILINESADTETAQKTIDYLHDVKIGSFLQKIEENGDSVIEIKDTYTINPRTGVKHIYYTIVYRSNNSKKVLTEKNI